MKARCLKMRKDVWTFILFSGVPVGVGRYVSMGRQVMYYLESDLPLCLIRTWLREALTGGFFPCVRMSAQECWWTCSHARDLDQYYQYIIDTLYVKCSKLAAKLDLSCVWTGCVIRIFRKHYCALHYWPDMGQLQSLWCCWNHMSVICQDYREPYFIQSLIKVETPSGLLCHCSASKPQLICSLSH